MDMKWAAVMFVGVAIAASAMIWAGMRYNVEMAKIEASQTPCVQETQQ